ncbi:hypothetical protein S83_066235 [Arachis hypogaea]|uniref:TF-B3 domain-containing protein n=1 Tax=Arachis hypogaea TaxID=3818 RepID=A0A6B9V7I7_ARAHY|nr:uncharacterized protein DS421_19g652200 [Arachis hypogaea]
MDDKMLMPLEFKDDRVFYMEVDPQAFLHELPSLFYRNYKHMLGNKMHLIDFNENQVELMIGKGNIFSYILNRFDNLVNIYGLQDGGRIKLVYVGENVFVLTKVRDNNMVKK